MEPTLDEALTALFRSPGPQTAPPAQIRNTQLEEARTQLLEVQKAIDSLKRLLNEPAANKSANTAPHK